MRSQAREKAFQLIFERLFVKEDYSHDEEFFVSLKKDEDKAFSKELVNIFIENREELTSIISKNLIGYEIERVYKIDLALIYLALSEVLYIKTPPGIVVNEVVELSKKYSTVKSSKFINGVLSSIINKKDN